MNRHRLDGEGSVLWVGPDFPMPHGYLWQYELIRLVQSWHSPWLDRVLSICTWLGVETFYVIALALVLWAVNKKLGLRLAYIFLCSMYINGWFKDLFRVVRPIGIPGIQSAHLATATGYAMPSGHAQGTVTFWAVIGRWIRRPWFSMLVVLFVIVVGFSRVYFGLHWPLDVLVGWGIGLIIAVMGWWIGEWWTYRTFPFRVRMSLAVAIPVALLVFTSGPSSARYASLLLGLGVGAVAEAKLLGLELPKAVWRRLCAVVIGMAGLIALQWMIKWPTSGLPWTVLRDGLTGLWATLGAPYLFERCGLYHRDPSEADD